MCLRLLQYDITRELAVLDTRPRAIFQEGLYPVRSGGRKCYWDSIGTHLPSRVSTKEIDWPLDYSTYE